MKLPRLLGCYRCVVVACPPTDLQASKDVFIQSVQVAHDHFFMFLDMADQYVVSTIKDGIVYGLEHRVTAATVGATAMVVLLPGVRRSLWRVTFGRFTSPEQMVETCEGSIKSMVADLQAQKGEIAKLSERLQVAREQYASGLAKLRHAASEMRSLESRVQTSETKAKDLLYEIRNIRSKQALQLRSDAAVVVESAKRQRNQVGKIVGKLDSHGL
jgi:hypothetical protein